MTNLRIINIICIKLSLRAEISERKNLHLLGYILVRTIHLPIDGLNIIFDILTEVIIINLQMITSNKIIPTFVLPK